MQAFDLPEPATDRQAIAFSPDGRLLAVSGEKRVVLIDTAGGAVRPVGDEPDASCGRGSGLAFTAGGRELIVHRWRPPPAQCAITLLDVITGTVAREFPTAPVSVCEPRANGECVYIASGPKWGEEFEVARLDLLTGEASAPFRGYTTLQRLAVSVDGKWLAGGAYFYPVRVWNLGGKKPPQRPSHHLKGCYGNSHVAGMALSADGALVAVGDVVSECVLRFIEVRTGETWTADGRPIKRGLAFHPSRPILVHATKSGEVGLYDAAARTELKRYAWGIPDVLATAFSPDGLRCAAAGAGKVVVWDVDA